MKNPGGISRDEDRGDGAERSHMKMIRISQLLFLVPVSRTTIYDWMNPSSPRYDQTFPRPVRLAASARGGAVGWREVDVLSWIKARIDSPVSGSQKN